MSPLLQFALYAVVGGIAFVADLLVFLPLQTIGVHLLLASLAGFGAGTLVNYLLSRSFVFQAGRWQTAAEIASFVAVVLVGAALTTAMMALLTGPLGMSGLAAKFLAVPTVLVWNYAGRRLFVFQSAAPPRTHRAVLKAADAYWRYFDRKRGSCE